VIKKEEEPLNPPIFKQYRLTVKQENAQVECITLLSQVMLMYSDLNISEQQAIASWFHITYS